jgi:hypothetical protein
MLEVKSTALGFLESTEQKHVNESTNLLFNLYECGR